MISLALAFAPVATVSLFAAAIPVLTGLRGRHTARVAAGVAPAALEITGTSEPDGMQIGVRNRTSAAHTMRISVSFYGADGAEMARFEPGARRILGGRTARERLDLRHLPAGSYSAVVVAECDGEWFGARLEWVRAHEMVAVASAA